MSMETNLPGRLRNTSLPVSSGLLPVFEAVVNSIHSIEEAGLPPREGKISVAILRNPQQSLRFEGDTRKAGPEPVEDIIGFSVTDNENDATRKRFEVMCREVFKKFKACIAPRSPRRGSQ